MKRLEEFKKAYDAYPSQDNEGYVPDRGGFKCGFSACWDLLHSMVVQRDAEIEKLKEELKWRRGVHGITGEADKLRALLADAKEVIREADEYLTRADGVANFIGTGSILHRMFQAVRTKLRDGGVK